MDLAEAFSSFDTVVFWLLLPLLRMLAVLLLALRKRAGWLVLLVEPVVSLVWMTIGGGFSVGVLLLPAIAVYGWWRWRKRASGGLPPVRSVRRRDWAAAAVIVVLVLVVFAIQALPLMILHMVGPAAMVHTGLVAALTPLLYVGLARGVIEAWWIGITLALMGLANAVAGPDAAGPGNAIWLLEGLAVTVLYGLLYLYGWSKWRAARQEADASA
jgi:hypothetical protein